jgi:mannose/cellobiose epimerase-like protein (N-acyl-D-glucosamine 2-epimerase family)
MDRLKTTVTPAGSQLAELPFKEVNDIGSAHAAFRAWLFDHALPFWGGAGHEGPGRGAREHLRLDGLPADVPFKRMRVQARQIYVFSQATLLGWREGERLARQGYEFITSRGERSDGGWVRRLSPTGEVLDDAIDLYDQAFVLFALAWYIRLTGDSGAEKRARRTTEWIRTNMRAPHGGFHNVVPVESGPRQQNPHMHMLEAMLALYGTSNDAYYAEAAHELVDLFRRHFFDSATGSLGEFFERDWSPAAGAAGDHVEPGHHYEWVWLLDQYERLTSVSAMTEIDRLYRFARQHGSDQRTALVWDVVGRDGSARQRSTRLWPQTEALKAHAVMARRDAGGAEQALLVVRNLLGRFFRGCPAGAWVDQFDAAGEPTADKIPTSSFYHVLMSYAELDKLAGEAAA